MFTLVRWIGRRLQDTQTLANSIQSFFNDIQEYPLRRRTATGQRDAGFTTLTAFTTGDATVDPVNDPLNPSGFAVAYGIDGGIDRLNDHLVTERANYRERPELEGSLPRKTVNQDPWGRNDVVLARAASDLGSATTSGATKKV